MKFCSECDNMYYIKISEKNSNNLEFYCRFCKNVDTLVNNEGISIIKENKQENIGGNQVINEYTKLDPTLPRLYNLKCPNADCKTNEQDADDKNPEIIYIRVNDKDLKYVYLCNCCDFTWKTNESAM